jgi:mannose-1-phosphate guanylyltransferase/phosphomannomutase
LKAIIMAGGEGSRLRPLTCDLPKPMVPVINTPIMLHILRLLKHHGISDIGVTLQYMPEAIKDYFGNGAQFGANLTYFIEETPLGTAGSVKNAEDFLHDTFLVISGDALTDIDLSKAVDFHKRNGSLATMVLTKVTVPLEYGVAITNEDSRIVQYLEKPCWSEVFSDTVNTGIYILEPEIFKYYKKNQKFDFSKDLFPILLKEKMPMYGYVAKGYWCDIGNLEQYVQAHFDILKGKVKVNIPGTQIREGVWIGQNVKISDRAVINGPAVLGDNCTVSDDVFIDGFSIIGNNNVISDNTSIKRSITWDNVYIGQHTRLRGSILCSKVRIKENCSLFEGAVVGYDCKLDKSSTVKPGVKIWPNKTVEEKAIVNQSVVWGTKYLKYIFGQRGVTGEINVEITPEFSARIASSYGTALKQNSRVGICSNGNPSLDMVKHAMISGLLSTGIQVYDLKELIIPMARFAAAYYGLDGVIHISDQIVGKKNVVISFIGNKGTDVSRDWHRKIENLFVREDFRLCYKNDIKQVEELDDVKSAYVENLLRSLRTDAIRKRQLKCLISTGNGKAKELIEEFFHNLNISFRYFNYDTTQGQGELTSKNSDLIKNQIRKVKADFAAILEEDGEKLVIIDEGGRVVKDEAFYVLCSLIVLKSDTSNKVVVPITAPNIIEKLAMQYGGEVLRTKSSKQALMEGLVDNGITIGKGINQFNMYFDGIGGLLKIMEHLSVAQISLTQLLDAIPAFYLVKKTVHCPWDAKGKVMRSLIEEHKREDTQFFEGIKVVHDNGWALILPDGDQPICKIFSEGVNEEFAEELSDIYVDKIKHTISK